MVAILGVLVALLLPAVQSARAAARRLQCASNIRQVALGVILFAEGHRGRFPSRTHTEDDNRYLHWIQGVAPFVESVDAIRLCPDDPLGTLRMNGLPGSGEDYADPRHPDPEKRFTPRTSYVANGYLSFDDTVADAKSVNNLEKIPARSKAVMLFEAFSDPTILGNRAKELAELRSSHFDHTHSPSWFDWFPTRKDRVLRSISSEIQLDRHAGGSHFAYADGHVTLVVESQINAWVDTGFDFAKPY